MFTVSSLSSRLKVRTEALALGADTRQKICWSKDGRIFTLAPEREFADTAEFYWRACEYLKKRKHLAARFLAFDPHPYFICHRLAPLLRDRFFPEARLEPVQHHAAHVATCGLTQGRAQKYIGLAFDGTGWGEDGRIWGSEFFVYDGRSFARRGHFSPLALPGGEVAIRQPWRIGMGVAWRLFGRKCLEHPPASLKKIPARERRFVAQMVEKDVNTAHATSAGRYFDAVSALLGIRMIVAKEAEAAMALEKAAARHHGPIVAYPFDVHEEKDGLRAEFGQMFREICSVPSDEASRSEAGRRFHLTLASCTARMCRILAKRYRTKNVYASGGVFMNRILKEDLKKILEDDGLRLVFAPTSLMTDEGICAGQIAFLAMQGGAPSA